VVADERDDDDADDDADDNNENNAAGQGRRRATCILLHFLTQHLTGLAFQQTVLIETRQSACSATCCDTCMLTCTSTPTVSQYLGLDNYSKADTLVTHRCVSFVVIVKY